ncbi:MAG: amino acid adenylation domain-containing protein, partial [Bacteroidota bacterium]
MAGFAVVLSRFSFAEEINIGTPVLNRLSRADRKVFGPLINLLPLQIHIDADLSFSELSRQIKREAFRLLRHQKFQQADIIKALAYEGNRLYDVRISYERFSYQNEFAQHEAEIVALSNHSEEDPISVHIMDYRGEGLQFRFDVNGNYVPEYIADELVTSLQFIFENIADSVDKPIKTISVTAKEQLAEVKAISKGEDRPMAKGSFLELWRDNLHKFSSQKAIAYQDEAISYLDVNKRMKRLVAHLQDRGIGKGDRVAVLLDRSIDLIPTVLGVLQSGATYVPLDKTFPRERMALILKDSQVRLLLSDEDDWDFDCPHSLVQPIFEEEVGSTKVVSISPEDEAYIIYTSGSTGRPKGVSIRHESLIDYATTFSTYFRLTASDCVIQQSALVFDTSVEEIFPILTVGGKLLVAESPKDFHSLLQECSRHEVTLLSTNPFVVQYLSDHQADYELQLRILISGGDVLKREQVDHLLDSMEVYNTYGPTESTVCATYHKVRAEDVQLPIGKPIANRDVFLLNDQHLLPKGALGEIALAGMGLANGYLNQDQLTAALFVEVDGKRMYKTGDLGRWNEQGELLFQGRKDSQLSFRGYRIEPQEIEQAIKETTPSVRACHVSMREWQQAPALIAYVSASGQVDVDSLLKSLKKKLPAHMIPNHVLLLDAFPLNASGKIDSKRLPLPEKILAKAAMVFPSTAVEYEMANIWKKLLNLEEVDIHSSFFTLGGHSLLANQFIGIIREERKQDISLREFYEAPTIYEAAKLLETKEISHSFQLEKAPKQELYPLSYPQERLWFLDQLNQDNKSYYVPRAIKMRGQMNLKRIEKAFTLLTEKHEILRTVFPVVNGIPHQKILPPYYFSIPLHSLENLSPQEQEAEIQDFIFQEGNRLFDLEKGPLLRVYILRESERENILVFCEHHLIHDGWTQGILLREFIDVYSKLIEDENFQIEIPRLQFKDFSHWQKSFFDDERLDNHLSFWKQKLEGHIPVLPLPQKCKRPLQISGNGKLLIRTIDEEWSDKIRAFSVAHGATLFISMLAAFKLTLSRFSNESDICIGTAVANRRLASIENVLGMVINTIALRTQLDGTDSLGAALDKIKQTCFEAYTHEDTPFGKVVEHLSPTRSLGLMPLFQYMFSFMNTPSRNLFLPDLELEVIDSHNLTAKFDINVVVVTPFEQALQEGLEERNRTIMVEWEYNSDIYSEEVMNQMFDAYFAILETMVSSPSVPYKEVPCMGAEQRRELLEVFNDTQADYPKGKTVVDLFREQVERRPEVNALVYADKVLTYRELEHLSNGLANHLMDSVGQLKKEAIIGIQLQRSEWVVVSMLAILKAGAAYVSIDPDFPQKRIEYILQDANCPIVIDKDFIDAFAAGPFDPTAPAAEISVDQLAYLIYTSGSTGTPKGIMIEHGSLANLVFDYQMDVHRTSLSCKTVFDASVLEIMVSITSGSTLFIPEEEIIYSPQEYADFLCENKISHCYLHPMHLEEIAERLATYDDLHLQHIFIGVEGIKPSSVEWYFDNKIKILNAYGPTECTVCASYYRVENLADITTPNIPIGKPLSNCQLYILDGQSNRLQPKGVIGELCISGAGLSRGYLNLPDLTDKAFIPHPFKEGERLYKTGDLAKWLPDGNIEFLGRKDTQVKLRGHRIELGEIEHVLMNQQAVTQAVAIIVKQKEEKYLAAYLVGEEEMDVAALKDSLHAYLPAYMIPNHLIQLDSIPLTPNGKIDRKALPKIQLGADEKEYVAPRNETEAQLVAIWQEVLDVEKVGITDNFFALGGHSLKVTQLINRMNQQLSFTIGVKEIFTNPSIASLSE